MIRSALITCAFAAIAAPALASTTFTASLAEPVEKKEDFIADKALWTCDGETCIAELRRKTVTVRTCKKVAKEIGTLAGFGTASDALSEEDLAECNESAKR